MSDSYQSYATGLSQRRAPLSTSTMDAAHVPDSFPMIVWAEQMRRYNHYWSWFSGEELMKNRKTSTGKDTGIKAYPLKINPIANFAWKHAAILLGEESSDSPLPLARTNAVPRPPLSGGQYKPEEKELATMCKNILDEVWMNAQGRATQLENAVLTQFLGGCVFQVVFHHEASPEAQRLRIPMTVKGILPDFFVPVWSGNNFWDLTECYVVYRVPNHVIAAEYGKKYAQSTAGWGVYCEHWTRKSYSVFINNVPLTETVDGEVIEYNDRPHKFGFVPFVYIPHTRAGEFYGNSSVDDLEGLAREINSRMADVGDSMRETVHRVRYSTDIEVTPEERSLIPGVKAIALGRTNPATNATPKVETEDAQQLGGEMVNFSENVLWAVLLREGHLSNIAFGEDDVSQRSAIALAMRMFPTSAHSRAERTFWTEGLTLIAKMILRICVAHKIEIEGQQVPSDFEKRLQFSVDWLPQIPRDREAQVNEIILRFQAGLISLERALHVLGDSDYIEEEIKLIRQGQVFQASLEASKSAEGKSSSGSGAKTQMTSPVVSDGLGE